MNALHEQGYHTPTPIQAEAIPLILAGRDVLGCAQTGTGKTAAFALPVIHRLLTATVDRTRTGPVLPRVLVLSPTRELATQIADSFETYGAFAGLSMACVYGGVSQFHQVRALRRGVDVLIATPGRLMDLMEQGHINLTNVNTFILDEADRMLDMGFIQPIRMIASKVPGPRQTLLFSATMPREIMHLADSLLTKPAKVSVTPVSSAAPLIEQRLYMVPRNSKATLLQELLIDKSMTRAVVFTKTKHGADKLTKKLRLGGISVDVIHGNKAQNYRARALEMFRSGKSRVLVATDVAARGLDVDAISHVINFDLPVEPEAYIHRIGRTGRAGATGIAVSFCDHEERNLLRDIERLTGKKLPLVQLPKFSPEALAADAKAQRDSDADDRSERDYSNERQQRFSAPRNNNTAPRGNGYPRRQESAPAPHGHQGARDERPHHFSAAPAGPHSPRSASVPAKKAGPFPARGQFNDSRPAPANGDGPRSSGPRNGMAGGPARGPSRGPTRNGGFPANGAPSRIYNKTNKMRRD